MVETGVLEPEMVKTTPLDSSTYDFLFNTSRYPSKPEDHARKFDPSKNNHIVVARKGKFYEFQVVNDKGEFLSEKDLMRYVFRYRAFCLPVLWLNLGTSGNFNGYKK